MGDAPLGDDGPDDAALDDALDELSRWVADARVDEAVGHRRRAAWLSRQTDDEATLAGLLVDLAERGRPVVAHLATGRRHRGLVVAVGHDVMELDLADGSRVIVALAAVTSVRAGPAADSSGVGSGLGGEGQPVTTGATLRETLARLTGDRVPVTVIGGQGEVTSGELTAVGRDVLTVRLEGGGLAYVPLASVAEVSLTESG